MRGLARTTMSFAGPTGVCETQGCQARGVCILDNRWLCAEHLGQALREMRQKIQQALALAGTLIAKLP